MGVSVYVNGLSTWIYNIEKSPDLINWSYMTTVYGGECVTVEPGFYRAKIP
jgi:hypothetical protein